MLEKDILFCLNGGVCTKCNVTVNFYRLSHIVLTSLSLMTDLNLALTA